MSRSRAHRLLQLDLAAATGVPVEVRWGSCVPSVHHPGGWAWHVFWSDGPTGAGMRAKAERAARTLPRVDAEQLGYGRTMRPRSYGLAMIRQVRLGRPSLGHHADLAAVAEWLRTEPYPERGDAADVELADHSSATAAASDR
jgi:hypothetical protein